MNNAVIAVSVCLCGGLGAAARYVCDSVIKASWHKAFPLSTFVINSIAGFLVRRDCRSVLTPVSVGSRACDVGDRLPWWILHILHHDERIRDVVARWADHRVRGICADVGGGSCDGRGIGILPCRLRLERGR